MDRMVKGMPCRLSDVGTTVEHDGFAIVESLFCDEQVKEFMLQAGQSLSNGSAGDREALAWPWVQEIAHSCEVRKLVDQVLSPSALAIRAILFDKNPTANWNLGFHQDRAVPLFSRIDVEGFTGWSEKNGIPHALAPAWVLDRMLAVRISLDDCDLDNGPLRVLPGTHLHGILDMKEEDRFGDDEEVACLVRAGGAVLMKSLLLHASSAAIVPRHRRVLHIEFSDAQLPGGLEFYDWTAKL
jgi:hypothetical protein